MNRGKILTKNTNENFNIKYGTIDNKQIKSIYLNFTSWIHLNGYYDETDKSIIKKLKKNIHTVVYENLDESVFLKKLIITDLDIRESGLRNKRQTYMSLDVNLYQQNNFNFKEKKLTNEIEKLILLIENVLIKFKYFDFEKKKNKQLI